MAGGSIVTLLLSDSDVRAICDLETQAHMLLDEYDRVTKSDFAVGTTHQKRSTLKSFEVRFDHHFDQRVEVRLALPAEDVVRPAMPAECLLDRNALIMGYSGVYSSFLKHAVRQAERYGVPASALLYRAGQRKLIGGQED